ncbi:MAG: LPS export ABC transporter ATP-binding protein [Gemmataceae bacterium]|nr:LPS export ABC transporter ATP-binding protein [Gemmata sp.]MDW8197302.1 LPS export ABC transporter ATP-binding protein [Gemmataceae bacterium]
MPLLEVEGLVKYYGRRAVVNGVSFNVHAGEIVGLLGPNGAGKTTSFRMTTGQITPNDGRVLFNGEDVTTLPMYLRARRGMGYLSQEPSVFRKLTVEGNLLAILEALPRSRKLGRRLTKAERWQRTNEVLARFKLEHVRKNIAGRCSGGEKRRLEIARCLVCEPLLILLDEPFAAVDPKTTEDIRENIRELANSGIGILITDHNVREVFRTADRVYLITEGKVVTHGTPLELVNDQVAIDAYLGRSFEEDGFTRHFDARFAAAQRATAAGSTVRTAPAPATVAPRATAATAANAPTSPAVEVPTSIPAPPAPPATAPAPSTVSATPSVPSAPEPRPTTGSAVNPVVTKASAQPPQAENLPPGSVLTAPETLSEPTWPPSKPVANSEARAVDTPTPPPATIPNRGALHAILELEKLRRAVENLTNDHAVKASALEIVARGAAAIPVLLEAMERRDALLRQRAFEMLKLVAKEHAPFDYDPNATMDIVLRQVAYLRVRLEHRR